MFMFFLSWKDYKKILFVLTFEKLKKPGVHIKYHKLEIFHYLSLYKEAWTYLRLIWKYMNYTCSYKTVLENVYVNVTFN